MKSMRRLMAAILAAVLVLTLVGCSYTGDPGNREEDLLRLQQLLDEISRNVQAGEAPITPGLAGDFLAWAGSTRLTRQEVAQAAGQWLAAQTPELRRAAEEKLNGMLEQLSGVLKDGADALKNSDWDFSSIVKDILASGGL